MTTNAVEVHELGKSYGRTPALESLSFSIGRGETFGLLGPNGAGKTTTVNILSTYLEPDRGRVSICGYDAACEKEKVRQVIGVVPQEVALYPNLTALENLVFWARINGVPGKEVSSRAAELLNLVDLWDRRDDLVSTLSSGMKRRLNLAAGLVHNPKFLILDEPTVGIDVQTRRQIYNLVARLKSDGISILYTSHYLDEAERLCDRVAIIDRGAVLAVGATDQIVAANKDRRKTTSGLEDLFIELTGSDLRE